MFGETNQNSNFQLPSLWRLYIWPSWNEWEGSCTGNPVLHGVSISISQGGSGSGLWGWQSQQRFQGQGPGIGGMVTAAGSFFTRQHWVWFRLALINFESGSLALTAILWATQYLSNKLVIRINFYGNMCEDRGHKRWGRRVGCSRMWVQIQSNAQTDSGTSIRFFALLAKLLQAIKFPLSIAFSRSLPMFAR